MNEFLEPDEPVDGGDFATPRDVLEVEGFRLSPQQRRLWLAGDGAFPATARLEIRLVGPLDAGRLEAALRSLAQRHEILHTVFVRPPELKVAFQVVVEPSTTTSWNQVDVGALEEAEQETLVQEKLHSPLAATDLEDGPTLQAVLYRRADREHVLALRLPVLCADERSLLILAQELSDAYHGALGTGPGATRIEYRQFAAWQNGLLEQS
ncbi:MAG: hypothetical protein KDD47_04935, partial [Acidobacteria bacterium]|nr:hypothetical protein [Acidobacteriota bacterium]